MEKLFIYLWKEYRGWMKPESRLSGTMQLRPTVTKRAIKQFEYRMGLDDRNNVFQVSSLDLPLDVGGLNSFSIASKKFQWTVPSASADAALNILHRWYFQ